MFIQSRHVAHVINLLKYYTDYINHVMYIWVEVYKPIPIIILNKMQLLLLACVLLKKKENELFWRPAATFTSGSFPFLVGSSFFILCFSLHGRSRWQHFEKRIQSPLGRSTPCF